MHGSQIHWPEYRGHTNPSELKRISARFVSENSCKQIVLKCFHGGRDYTPAEKNVNGISEKNRQSFLAGVNVEFELQVACMFFRIAKEQQPE